MDLSVGDTLIRDGEKWKVEHVDEEDELVRVRNGTEIDSWSTNYVDWTDNVEKKREVRA